MNGEYSGPKLDPSLPQILQASTVVTNLLNASKFQLARCNFAGTYQSICDDEGDTKCQRPVQAGMGLEEYQQFFNTLLAHVDVVKPPDIDNEALKSLMNAVWQFGCTDDFSRSITHPTACRLPRFSLRAIAVLWYLM